MSAAPLVELAIAVAGGAALYASGERSPRGRLASGTLAALAALGSLPVLRSLRTADLNWCYGYTLQDSFDWIANGLFWAGQPVAASFRPPGLPLLIAALWRLGLLHLLPLLNILVLMLTAAALQRFLLLRFTPPVAALAAWVFFANSYLQWYAPFVMAELYATLFLVLAAQAFARAGEDPRLYRRFGAALGAGFLFHYAAPIAGLGFALAVLLTRRAQLRRRELWEGALLATALPIVWLLVRHALQVAHPGHDHPVESLLRLTAHHAGFYAVAVAALLGLALLPLYAVGAARLLLATPRCAVADAALAAGLPLLLFWAFLYDWRDKRFLIYVLPFAMPLLAAGIEALLAYARRSPAALAVVAAYLPAALLWNQIAYPPFGIQYLALTPRDFIDLGDHLEGASVVRYHRRMRDALGGALFDFRRRPLPCADAGGRAELEALKPCVDRALRPGEPLGVAIPPLAPVEGWVAVNRLSNLLLRPMAAPEETRLAITEDPALVRGLAGVGVTGGWRLIPGRSAAPLSATCP